MSANKTASEIPIKAGDLSTHLKRASGFLSSASHASRRDVASLLSERSGKKESAGITTRALDDGPAAAKTLSVLSVAKEVNRDDSLMEENINAALNTVRTGLMIGLHLATLFEKASGLERLRERQGKGLLTNPADQSQWTNLMEAQATITIFCCAYYVAWKMSAMQETLSTINVAFEGLPEPLRLARQGEAIQASVYHWGSYLQTAQTGLEFAKLTELYWKAVLDDVKAQVGALAGNAEVFTDKNYRLEGTNFTVNGFAGEIIGGGRKATFKPVEMSSIVGNREAKRFARRIAQRLIAYCFERKLNPLVELDAFSWTYLMQGKPGTGKTLLLAAIVTEVTRYCEKLGIPCRGHEMPGTMISTFQGGSAENMQNWFNVLKNPSELIVATMDDVEAFFQSRSDQNISAGVKECISTFLTNTEGATAIMRGNAIIVSGTNRGDMLDSAVMNRMQGRALVNGAETVEDWMDQIRLWAGKMDAWGGQFFDLRWPDNYTFLSSQQILPAAKVALENAVMFRDRRLVEIHERLLNDGYKTDDYLYFGHLYNEVTKLFPLFSSRDERNIKTATMGRFFDFDFDDTWLNDRSAFVDKSYDEKKAMILELARSNSDGAKFSKIMFEEAVRYIDNSIEILEGGTNIRIKETVERMRETAAANVRFREENPELAAKMQG